MSALGKTLAVFVFLGSLVWLGFTAALFSTRANWKAVADDATVKVRQAEDRANALTDQVREDRKLADARLAAAEQSLNAMRIERDSARDEYAKLKASTDAVASQTQKLQPVLDEYQSVNATLPVSLVMVRAIRDYLEATGFKVGFKPAGGLRTAKDAMNWQILMKEELGREWLEPDLFRIGASSMLADIERQIEHYVTGRYAALNRHAMA